MTPEALESEKFQGNFTALRTANFICKVLHLNQSIRDHIAGHGTPNSDIDEIQTAEDILAYSEAITVDQGIVTLEQGVAVNKPAKTWERLELIQTDLFLRFEANDYMIGEPGDVPEFLSTQMQYRLSN